MEPKTLIGKNFRPSSRKACLNVFLIKEDVENLKYIAFEHGMTYLSLIKILINNYDSAKDKIVNIDTNDIEMIRTSLELGDEKTLLEKIADANKLSLKDTLQGLIRSFLQKDKPREYAITYKITM